MARVSCKKLSEILIQNGWADKIREEASPEGLRECCEAFGTDVRCYVSTESHQGNKAFANFLGEKNIYPIWCGETRVEIGVTYFKAWHWDE